MNEIVAPNIKRIEERLQRIESTLERIESDFEILKAIDVVRLADLLEAKLSAEVEREVVINQVGPLSYSCETRSKPLPHRK